METYPLEYVLHHVPLMAVLGLLDPVPAGGAPAAASDLNQQAVVAAAQPASSVKKTLLACLMAKNNTSIWESTGKGVGLFHVLSLDKSHTFPAKKSLSLAPTNRPSGPVVHSQLSPLTPNSPLHPDGIMSPLWVKKHRQSAPSVVVGFYELWEKPTDPFDVSALAGSGGARKDPLGVPQQVSAQEKDMDQQLCHEINDKRRNVQDRGIKFSVVLLLKTTPNESPRIEERIQFIRRGCSLDTKNSLFVFPIADSTPNTVQEFVTGLQKHLYENAANYYREHGKRIKKKKSKLPAMPLRPPTMTPTIAGNIFSAGAPPPAKPLNPMGWSVRYDYKMGVFAEFRQDLDSAARHYEGAYQTLVDMFHSSISGGVFAPGGGGSHGTEILHPFTPRWNEARVLADTINIKICKLSLYTDSPLPALHQLQKHIINFKCLPEFLGNTLVPAGTVSVEGVKYLANIAGGGSFEYWAWLSKQFRVFGELVEIATSKIGLKVPFPPPGSTSVSPTGGATAATQNLLNTISNTSMNVISGGEVPISTFGPFSASNPNLVVQHAGFYYLMAARCAEERWSKFVAAEEKYQAFALHTSYHGSIAEQVLAAERAVDHGTFVIDLLTKSYEQFKKYKSGRMTLFLASEIARVYHNSGKHEMALKFFDRIGRTYRKENWPAVIKFLLSQSVLCGKVLGRREGVIECLVELLSDRITTEKAEKAQVLEELLTVLHGQESWGRDVPRAPKIRVTMDMDQLYSFVSCQVQFKKANGYVRAPASFQVTLKTDGHTSPPTPIRLSHIRVHFSNRSLDHVWKDSGVPEGAGSLQWIDCSGASRDKDPDPADSSNDKETAAPVTNLVSIAHVDLGILPGMRKVFEGVVVPTESQDLKIAAVSLVIETPASSLCLMYKVGDRPEDTATRRKWLGVDSTSSKPKFITLDGFGEQSTVRIIRRQPNVSVTLRHTPPGLLEEIYPVVLEVINEEDESIQAFVDVEFKSSTLTDAHDTTSLIALNLSDLMASNPHSKLPIESNPKHITDVTLGTIAPGSKAELPFYLRTAHHPGERVLYVTVNYNVLPSSAYITDSMMALNEPAPPSHSSSHPHYHFRKNESLRVPFSKPFEWKFEHHTKGASTLPAISEAGLLSSASLDAPLTRSEKWMVSGHVKCLSPFEIEVKETGFEGGRDHAGGVVVVVKDVSLKNGGVENIPSNLKLHHPFTIPIHLQNPTLTPIDIHLSVESSEAFVFSGLKSTTLRILPLGSTKVAYTCFPLLVGRTPLPRIKLRVGGLGSVGGGVTKGSLSEEGVGVLEGEEVKVLWEGGSIGKGGDVVVFVHPKEE
ncbi:hypothetical protein HDV05_001934 [Chytridiales sp. JEL 0842]|nr:hypothetical protein HDV05_001934 [Chytridiales sp. JEL 0842]